MINEELLQMADTTEYGVSTMAQVEALSKALLAPESVADMYNTPGGSITMQSLEGMLVDLTLNQNDFPFWQDVNKMKAFSTVEEFNQQIGHGINLGGFVDQIENPEFRDPDIQKQIAVVKYMSEGWTVGDVAEATRRMVDERTRSQRSAMIRLLRNLEMASYSGNAAWIPRSFTGIAATIATSGTAEQVRDMRGGNVSMATFNLAGQLITEANGHVENSMIYVSPAGVQNLSTIIEAGAAATGDRKIVEMGDGGVTIGGKITGVMTAYGLMKPRMDKVLGLCYESRSVPQFYANATATWTEGATSEKAPSAPAIALAAVAGVANSQFAAGVTRPSAATYAFRVVARNAFGASAACAPVIAAAVAAGGGITITITPNPADAGAKLPSCFEIFSEQVAGSGVFRYMHTIPAAVAPLAVVAYTDINDYIPGTGRMFIVDQTQTGEDRVMAFSQLLPIHNTDLAKMGRYSHGLINLYGVPKYYKPNVLVEIRNVGVTQSNVNLFNTI